MGGSNPNQPPALLIWSPHHADELAEQAAGWCVSAGHSDTEAAKLLLSSGARVVVVDTREDRLVALAVVADLGGVVAAGGGALLVLASQDDPGLLDKCLDAGASHFLLAPWSMAEFGAALRFAARSAERRASARRVEPLAEDLRRAIVDGEIDVLFQPQVAFATGAIVGVEALARWEHPRLGAIGAKQLFATAERAGLGPTLSAHVQTLALQRASAWPGSLDALRLSVNVTADDLANVNFTPAFLARAAASRFPVARLTAEITETGLITALDQAAERLGALRQAGCRVAIDDFGTGYSSLAYLKALPLDYLKIDRALTQDIAGSARDRAIVEGVIGIARALGLTVIAEGVETAEQRDALKAAGSDLYQGFLCAEAVDADALVKLVGSEAFPTAMVNATGR